MPHPLIFSQLRWRHSLLWGLRVCERGPTEVWKGVRRLEVLRHRSIYSMFPSGSCLFKIDAHVITVLIAETLTVFTFLLQGIIQTICIRKFTPIQVFQLYGSYCTSNHYRFELHVHVLCNRSIGWCTGVGTFTCTCSVQLANSISKVRCTN